MTERFRRVLVLAGEVIDDIDRMAVFLVDAGEIDDFLGELLHCRFGLVGGDGRRRPSPDVADRHTAETGFVLFAVPCFDGDVDVDQHRLVDDAAAELHRGAEDNRFEAAVGALDANVGGFAHEEVVQG